MPAAAPFDASADDDASPARDLAWQSQEPDLTRLRLGRVRSRTDLSSPRFLCGCGCDAPFRIYSSRCTSCGRSQVEVEWSLSGEPSESDEEKDHPRHLGCEAPSIPAESSARLTFDQIASHRHPVPNLCCSDLEHRLQLVWGWLDSHGRRRSSACNNIANEGGSQVLEYLEIDTTS